ncbi:hypothetical protein AgCh_019513 [Apium graveolens]
MGWTLVRRRSRSWVGSWLGDDPGHGLDPDWEMTQIESLSLTFHGHDLIVNSELELNYGRRYGLLGLNGCGKSTLLTFIRRREIPISEHMDIFHLIRDIEASDMSSLEAVKNCGCWYHYIYSRE